MRLLLATLLVTGCADRGLTDKDTTPRDAVAPTLDVTAPGRGTILTGAMSVEVRGRVHDEASGVARVLVNDHDAPVDAQGNFKVTLPLTPGLNLLHTSATDKAGNEQSDTRAVLAGTLVSVDTMVKDAFTAHIDGSALGLIGDVVADALGGLDLGNATAALNPIVNIPVPCLGARVDITRFDKGKIKMNVVPVEGGLALDGEIDDIEVGLHVDYDLACDQGSGDVLMTATSFTISGVLALKLGADGKVAVDTSGTTSVFHGFNLETDVLPQGVTDFIENPVGAALGPIVAIVIQDQVPPLLEKLIGGETRVPVLDQELAITLRPTALSVDTGGLTVTLDSRIFVPGDNGIVFLESAEQKPSLDGLPGMAIRMGLADNAINQVLASLWGVGLLDQTFNVTDAGNYAGIGVLFDRVELGMRLPPVVSAQAGGVKIAAGDVECTFYKGNDVVTRLSMSAETSLTAGIAGNKLSLTATDPVVWLDVLSDGVSGANPLDTSVVRQLGSFAAQNLVGFVTGLIGKLPIPSVDGVAIANAQVTTGGGGYLLVSGDLTPATK
jgi:hypothetical protein